MLTIYNRIIIHYDEITLKGKNQNFFISKLIENIQNGIRQNMDIAKGGSKLILKFKNKLSQSDYLEIIEVLRLMPGIANFAPAIECRSDLNSIVESAVQITENQLELSTFKIETRRSFKQFPMGSMEVSQYVGGEVLKKFEGQIKVDIKKPALRIKIEIDKDKVFVLDNKIKGVSGLPVGCSGKVVCLLSGGIDSPVASFQMMKRGAKVVFVHFHNKTLNKNGVEIKIKKLVKQLEKVQGKSRLYIIPFESFQKAVIANIPADMRMIIYRRIMYKLASLIMDKEKAGALITGDSLAQVASQTLENMQVIYEATDKLKLAPLIGMNKTEIVEISEKIGTYEISIEPYEDCCSFMIAKHPQTKSKLKEVLAVEKNINFAEIAGELDLDNLFE